MSEINSTFLTRIGNGTKPYHDLYRCACGREKEVNRYTFRDGEARSCGCMTGAFISAKKRTHGQSIGRETRTYRAWQAMRRRCYYVKHKNYLDYGGRGITVCDRWRESFESFLADMGDAPGEFTLDRIDNDGNYEPGNCRWVDQAEQKRNTRASHNVTYAGKTQCVAAWAEELGISYRTLMARLVRGWSVERALTSPTNGKFRSH
jgi:hypothetical protein